MANHQGNCPTTPRRSLQASMEDCTKLFRDSKKYSKAQRLLVSSLQIMKKILPKLNDEERNMIEKYTKSVRDVGRAAVKNHALVRSKAQVIKDSKVDAHQQTDIGKAMRVSKTGDLMNTLAFVRHACNRTSDAVSALLDKAHEAKHRYPSVEIRQTALKMQETMLEVPHLIQTGYKRYCEELNHNLIWKKKTRQTKHEQRNPDAPSLGGAVVIANSCKKRRGAGRSFFGSRR
ncbi:hypothetical protein [Dendrolimus punctatus cypovirus 22]|uniref:hypothetical protein n=1 Tax=Dendrolimus punctatus cypovirus 22 TaxID=1577776 RepID=UPI0005401561|nr:hypothetical protein [Dendrolimus punctatus cypovirus 22]AIY60610.1 hypothetical protein [Dendrolimus punctatus cypovirus 22]